MSSSSIFLLAQSERVVYQWSRIEQLDQAWHWFTLIVGCLLAASFVVWLYRRDAAEQMRPVGWALCLLRIVALVGLLLYFLQLEKRTEQKLVRESRVAVLVDTSLSMTREGTPTSSGRSPDFSRSEEAVQLIKDTPFLRELNERHQVSVYRFDQVARPVSLASIEKKALTTSDSTEPSTTPASPTESKEDLERLRDLRPWLWLAIGGITLALIGFLIAWGAQIAGAKQWQPAGWSAFMGAVLFVAAMLLYGFSILPFSEFSLASLLGMEDQATSQEQTAEEDEAPSVTLPEDWAAALQPRGIETKLGDALKSILTRESGAPLAGIVVLTDGRNNSGLDPREVTALAQANRVPLYMIGLGSADRPANVELVEVDVPKRLYPGDPFSLKAYINASGFKGQTVSVQVLAGSPGTAPEQMSLEDELAVSLGADGEIEDATFQLEPKAIGEWTYLIQVIPPAGDAIEEDNAQQIVVEVIERKNRVLIFAGGPMRDYQFVRNLLYRDRDVESHVLLQTASELTSQEAQELLTDFPADRAALSEYDAILAFDPDWTQVPDLAIANLEKWVAEQAGGLVIVAGSVEMPKWTARSASGMGSSLLRSLSPVILERSGNVLLASGRVESETAWPLTLTEDGRQTDYLWVTEDARSSLDFWQDFEGVYSYYSAYQLKPGARALMHFGDPASRIDGQQPIYMASQYYGAGRTMFLGGSELWRIRLEGEQYFDRLFTKLVRWVSQGRLLLDSDRGVLLVDREQTLMGDQVGVRAMLKNEFYEPLVQKEVLARLIDPDNLNTPLVLRPMPDGSQPGVYTGQFPVLKSGEYSVQLQLGGVASEDVLTASVQAKVPVLEMQRTERNDALLRRLAVDTGGNFWTGIQAAMTKNDADLPEICAAITLEDQVAFLPGTRDQVFQLRWLAWLMALVAGSLSLEWFTRRFHRLA